MIADALERQGKSIACNRTGANLAYGVATTLLQTKGTVEWGVFESDELWLAHTSAAGAGRLRFAAEPLPR